MSDLPTAYPGPENTTLDAQIELSVRQLWDKPEFRTALVEDGYEDMDLTPQDLALTEAVDLALRALWTPASALTPLLQGRDYRAAAAYLRSRAIAPDELRIAPLNDVATAIRTIIERIAAP